MINYSVREIQQFQIWAKIKQAKSTIAILEKGLKALQQEEKKIKEMIG